jgi:hypothetical protein
METARKFLLLQRKGCSTRQTKGFHGMFANVANMKNLFFENLMMKTQGDRDIFYLRDAIIPIDTSDIKEVLEGADNALSFMASYRT